MAKAAKKPATKTVNHPYRPNAIAKAQIAEPPLLSFDNWEIIAGHLDFVDLTNLAGVCTDAREAAQLIFKRKYPLPELHLRVNANEVETSVQHEINGIRASVDIKGVIGLKLLRNFGHLFSKLVIDTGSADARNDNRLDLFIEYVGKFCREIHKKLTIRKYLPILIAEPLTNVDEMVIKSNEYSGVKFHALTRNVRSLEICSDRLQLYLNQNMPHLRKLKIIATNYNDIDGTGDKHIARMINLNPQIQVLEFMNHRFHFAMTLNTLILQFERSIEFIAPSLKMIQPEKFQRLFFGPGNGLLLWDSSVSFLKKFINLTWLSTEWVYYKHFPEIMSAMPNLRSLHVSILSGHFREFTSISDRIILSALPHRSLSVLFFDFESLDARNFFRECVNRQWVTESWSIHLHETPIMSEHSLILYRIQSA